MPTRILKAERDLDLYVGWSRTVNSPLFWGTRSEVAKHLQESAPYGVAWASPERIEEHLARADRTGTTALRAVGAWDGRLIYKQRGMLPHRNLTELIRRLDADEHDPVTDLLEPFDDEPKVRQP